MIETVTISKAEYDRLRALEEDLADIQGAQAVEARLAKGEEELIPAEVDTPWLLLDVCDHGIILFDPRAVLACKLASLRLRLRELGSRRIELADGSWYWDLKPDLRPGEVFTL